jgi:hypothetical protein
MSRGFFLRDKLMVPASLDAKARRVEGHEEIQTRGHPSRRKKQNPLMRIVMDGVDY